MRKGGRPKKEEMPIVRTNLALTPQTMDMLNEIMTRLGLTSRSEAMRHCIVAEYTRLADFTPPRKEE